MTELTYLFGHLKKSDYMWKKQVKTRCEIVKECPLC